MEHTKDILDNFSGILHSDCEMRYQKMALRDDIEWQPCLAHARRKFFESEGPIREEVLSCFKDIFMNEREAWEMNRKERLEFRKLKQEPLMDKIFDLLEQE